MEQPECIVDGGKTLILSWGEPVSIKLPDQHTSTIQNFSVISLYDDIKLKFHASISALEYIWLKKGLDGKIIEKREIPEFIEHMKK